MSLDVDNPVSVITLSLSATTPGPPAGLSLRGLTKVFGQTRALTAVDLDIESGKVLGLLGHNGSGKSTLFKILAGVYAPDAGELYLHGDPVALPLTSARASEIGLTFVHQDIVLLPRLTVAENMFLERNSTDSSRRVISWRSMRAAASTILSDYGLDIDADAQVSTLGPGERTQMGIARAAYQASLRSQHGGAFLMLDEPTVFLTQSERVALFKMIRSLAASDVGIVLVSHDLGDIMTVTDSVCVLRDGRVAALRQTGETSADQLAADIIGNAGHVHHAAGRSVAGVTRGDASPVVQVRGMTGRGVHGIDFDLHKGEVLGLTGLAGAGFSRALYLLYGSKHASSGEVTLGGSCHALNASTPSKSLAAGIVLVPGNRREDGLMSALSASENLALPMLDRSRRFGHVQARALVDNFAQAVPTYAITPPIAEQPAGEFSGGNQQKLLMAKWLQTEPSVVLVDEPTQGVDVGARQEILRRLRHLAESGQSGVLIASADYDQLAEVCDRVLVLAHGRIVTELVGDEVTVESISTACLGGTLPRSPRERVAVLGSDPAPADR